MKVLVLISVLIGALWFYNQWSIRQTVATFEPVSESISEDVFETRRELHQKLTGPCEVGKDLLTEPVPTQLPPHIMWEYPELVSESDNPNCRFYGPDPVSESIGWIDAANEPYWCEGTKCKRITLPEMNDATEVPDESLDLPQANDPNDTAVGEYDRECWLWTGGEKRRIPCHDEEPSVTHDPQYLNYIKVRDFLSDWQTCDGIWNRRIMDYTDICQPMVEEIEWVIQHLQRNLDWVKSVNGQ